MGTIVEDYSERRMPMTKGVEGKSASNYQQCSFCGAKMFSRGGVFGKCECDDAKNSIILLIEKTLVDDDKSRTFEKYIVKRRIGSKEQEIMERLVG